MAIARSAPSPTAPAERAHLHPRLHPHVAFSQTAPPRRERKARALFRHNVVHVPLLSALKAASAVAVISAAAFVAGAAAVWTVGNHFGLAKAIEDLGKGIGLSNLHVSTAALMVVLALCSAAWTVLMIAAALVVTASFNAAARLFGGIHVDMIPPPDLVPNSDSYERNPVQLSFDGTSDVVAMHRDEPDEDAPTPLVKPA